MPTSSIASDALLEWLSDIVQKLRTAFAHGPHLRRLGAAAMRRALHTRIQDRMLEWWATTQSCIFSNELRLLQLKRLF